VKGTKFMDRSNSVIAVSNSAPGIVVYPRCFVSCQPVEGVGLVAS
jgi:hypothetical protein